MYEVCSAVKVQRFDGKEFLEDVLETRRSDRKAAENDVEILKFLGKKAWIVEVE